MLPLSSWAEDLLNKIVGPRGFAGEKASSFRFMPLYPYGFSCKDIPSSSLFPVAAAAAKSLQWCPTLWDPIDSSPPGSSVPGILQAGTLEWVAITVQMPGFFRPPSTLGKNGFRGSVDSGEESSIQKQLAFQFALLKHPLSESSGCLKGLDIMTHLSGCLRIYQKSSTE